MAFALTLALAMPAGATADEPYNVLLVSIDSLRRDAVGCYGAGPPPRTRDSATPNLDRLAAGGVRMLDAYASSSWTLPSHVSLLTGQQPLVHQVETDLHSLGPQFATLAEMLRVRGYRTAGVFSGPYLEPVWGFDRGFERYRATYDEGVAVASRELGDIDARIAAARARGDRETEEALRWTRRTRYQHVRKLSHAGVSSERVTTAALDDLAAFAAADAPWFLFVHYFDVHYDYVPPPPWSRRFDPDYAGAMTGRGFLANPGIAVADPAAVGGFLRRVDDRDLDHLRALYAGETGWVDEHVGRLLAWLDAHDLARRTLVVVVSDHGDEFFEHAGIGHRRTLFEEVLRIPLLLRLPGVLPAGRAAPGLVSLADVVPTVLAVLGLPARTDLGGESMLPLARGDEDGADRGTIARLVRFYDVTVHLDAATGLPVTLVTVREAFRTGTIKVIRQRAWPLVPSGLSEADRVRLLAGAQEEFRDEDLAWIDLSRSPREEFAAFSGRFDEPRARAALKAFRTRYRELRTHANTTAPRDLDPAVRAALEGLGYLEPGAANPTVRGRFVLPLPRVRTGNTDPE